MGKRNELNQSLLQKKKKRAKNVEKRVSNKDIVKVEGNQKQAGGGAWEMHSSGEVDKAMKRVAELMDTEDAVTAISSGFWEAGRVESIKLYTDFQLEDPGTCC